MQKARIPSKIDIKAAVLAAAQMEEPPALQPAAEGKSVLGPNGEIRNSTFRPAATSV